MNNMHYEEIWIQGEREPRKMWRNGAPSPAQVGGCMNCHYHRGPLFGGCMHGGVPQHFAAPPVQQQMPFYGYPAAAPAFAPPFAPPFMHPAAALHPPMIMAPSAFAPTYAPQVQSGTLLEKLVDFLEEKLQVNGEADCGNSYSAADCDLCKNGLCCNCSTNGHRKRNCPIRRD